MHFMIIRSENFSKGINASLTLHHSLKSFSLGILANLAKVTSVFTFSCNLKFLKMHTAGEFFFSFTIQPSPHSSRRQAVYSTKLLSLPNSRAREVLECMHMCETHKLTRFALAEKLADEAISQI